MTLRTQRKALAALIKSPQGQFTLCTKPKAAPEYYYFDDAEQLQQGLKSRQISAAKWIVAVSAEDCICKKISLPADDLEQAMDMVEFEIESVVPVSMDKIVYGCSLVSMENEIITLMVYIIKAERLEEILSSYKDIGVKAARISVDEVAINQWFEKSRTGLDFNINILADSAGVWVMVSHQKNLLFSKKIKATDGDISGCLAEFEDVLDRCEGFISEMEGCSVRIAGTDDGIKKIQEMLGSISERFTPKAVSVVDIGDEKEKDLSILRYRIAAEGLICLAEEKGRLYPDLMPQKYRKRVKKQKRIFDLIVSSGLIIAACVCMWLCMEAMNWRVDKSCKMIQAKIAPIEHISETVESKRQKLKAIQKQFESRGLISRIFCELYKYSPEDISLSQLNFKTKAESAIIDIKGQAESLSDAFEYSDHMEKSALLKNISINNVQQNPKAGGSIVEFQGNFVIRSN